MQTILKTAAVGVLALGVSVANPAFAQNAAEFYRGKTVTVLCPFDAGGGYGRLTTLIAKFLGEKIAGTPSVVAKFMPGGGGIKMANYLSNAAPRDGSTIGLIFDAIPTAQLLYAERGIKYKAEEFVPLGSLAVFDPGIIGVRSDTPVKNIADVKRVEVVIGAAGKAATQYFIPSILNRTIGTKFKIVLGYKGLGTIFAGMDRDEVDGTLASYSFFHQARPQEIRDGKIRWLVQMAIERDPRIKDVPLLQEVTDDEKVRKVFEFLTRGRTMQKALMAPPGTPADRAAALRRAIEAMAADKAFIAAAGKQKMEIEGQGWRRLEKVIAETVRTDPAVVNLAKELLGG